MTEPNQAKEPETGQGAKPSAPEPNADDRVPLIPRVASALAEAQSLSESRQAFEAEVRNACANQVSTSWLRKSFGRVSRLTSGLLNSEDRLAKAATLPLYQLMEERLAACEKCPHSGGACDGGTQEGYMPEFNRDALAFRMLPCPRWKTWLVRRRLLHSQIPQHLVSSTIDVLRRANEWPIDPDVAAWVDGLSRLDLRRTEHNYSWLVFTTANQQLSSKIGAAILSYAATLTPKAVAYRNYRMLEGQLKDFYDGGDREVRGPLDRVKTSAVLMVDHYEPSRGQAWYREKVETALCERSLRPTIIVSSTEVKDLIRQQPMLGPIFETAVSYRVT